MTIDVPERERALDDLRRRLTEARYRSETIERCSAAVLQFHRYLDRRGLTVDQVDSSHVASFWRQQRRDYQRLHGSLSIPMKRWRQQGKAGLNHYFRGLLGRLPAPPPIPGAPAALVRSLLAEYEAHLAAMHDLAAGTISGLLHEARSLLLWCQDGGLLCDGVHLQTADVDAYLKGRASLVRRTTCKTVGGGVRRFLAFLHAHGRIPIDLSACVITPTLYQHESIPSILRSEEITAVLARTRQDRSRKGRRDYAILMLLATYGIRSGEIARLKLEDINWRAETIFIVQSKTKERTTLPLLAHVGEALLAYLRSARPRVAVREFFVRMKPPFVGLQSSGTFHNIVNGRLTAAGIRPPGKRGPHLFRHTRAVTLLRAHVPVKTIADVLGHRSPNSTTTYIKLQSEELRAVALPLPIIEEVSHERLA